MKALRDIAAGIYLVVFIFGRRCPRPSDVLWWEAIGPVAKIIGPHFKQAQARGPVAKDHRCSHFKQV